MEKKKSLEMQTIVSTWLRLGEREYKGSNENYRGNDVFIIITLVMVPLYTHMKIYFTVLINAT